MSTLEISLAECDGAFVSTAAEIGFLYRKAKEATVEAVGYYLECGNRLLEEKAKHKHGKWMEWLRDNEETLGFGISTADRLMRQSNSASTRNLNEQTALEISREMWGNDKPHVANNSGENEWYTPKEYIMAAKKVMGGIDVDPASNAIAQATVGASAYYTKEANGLDKQWNGRVWINPPYSSDLIQLFIDQLIDELEAGRCTEAILLTNNATDTAWFHKAEEIAKCICFTRGRVKFETPDGEGGSPLQGQSFFYFGDNELEFRSWFSEFGFIR